MQHCEAHSRPVHQAGRPPSHGADREIRSLDGGAIRSLRECCEAGEDAADGVSETGFRSRLGDDRLATAAAVDEAEALKSFLRSKSESRIREVGFNMKDFVQSS